MTKEWLPLFVLAIAGSGIASAAPLDITLAEDNLAYERASPIPGSYRITTEFDLPKTVEVLFSGGDFSLTVGGVESRVWPVSCEADIEAIDVTPAVLDRRNGYSPVPERKLEIQYSIRRGGSLAPFAPAASGYAEPSVALASLRGLLAKDLLDPGNPDSKGSAALSSTFSYDLRIRLRSAELSLQLERSASLWLGPAKAAGGPDSLEAWLDSVSSGDAASSSSGDVKLLFLMDVSPSFSGLVKSAFESLLDSIDAIEAVSRDARRKIQVAVAFYDSDGSSLLKTSFSRDYSAARKLLLEGLERPMDTGALLALDVGQPQRRFPSCFDILRLLDDSRDGHVVFVHDSADSAALDSLEANAEAFARAFPLSFHGIAMDSGSADFPTLMAEQARIARGTLRQVDESLRDLGAAMRSSIQAAIGFETAAVVEGIEAGTVDFMIPRGTAVLRAWAY